MSVQVAGHTLPTEGGFRTGLLIGCGVALVAAAITVAIPTRRAPTPPNTAPTEPLASSKA
jgi:hypothetical protein